MIHSSLQFLLIMLHLICIFTFLEGHAEAITEYISIYTVNNMLIRKKTLLRLINLSAQFIFYIHLYDVNDESARAGMHLLEQTDCLEMHCANILSTGCFM